MNTDAYEEDRPNLKAALLDLGRDNYNNLRVALIGRLGYEEFRKLQNDIFKEIGTIKYEKKHDTHTRIPDRTD